PDALRYYIAVAGPETQDSDFTWDEFVRRNNFELANEWGNLVNRSISMAAKNVGAIPAATDLRGEDFELLGAAKDAFAAVGNSLRHCRFKEGITEAMRVVGLANKYISESEPWKLADQPERRDSILHVALQVVQDANALLTPFLPHAAQKVHELLGGEGVWAAQPAIAEVSEEGGPDYPTLQGEYASQQAVWESRPLAVGTPLGKPVPLFAKLDPKLGETGPDFARLDLA
ncbi:MAG: class I tRNA ligase family protein, partial [Propionibacteriaceae bacterium]|nr:class I tRNA ligase family protein [Propionibacteriaceae bacterium]